MSELPQAAEHVELTHGMNCDGSHWDGDCTCGLAQRVHLQKITDLIQQMIVGAEVFTQQEGAEHIVTGYKIKTGALHKLIGILSLTVPINLPEAK